MQLLLWIHTQSSGWNWMTKKTKSGELDLKQCREIHNYKVLTGKYMTYHNKNKVREN